MFQENISIAYIDGSRGIYDGRIKDNSVRYARNAVNNFMQTYLPDTFTADVHVPKIKGRLNFNKNDTIEDKIKKVTQFVQNNKSNITDYLAQKIIPVQFRMKYAQNKAGKPDKMGVLGAAFEEMGKRISMPVKELTEKIKSAVSPENKELVSAASLDIDKNGHVDIAEYGASILAEDMLSTDPSSLKAENITGEVTSEGQVKLLAYASKKNYKAANETFKAVYDTFKLDEAQKEFISNPNNLIN